MPKIWIPASLLAIALVVNGCGGIGSSSSGRPLGGSSTSPQYTASLPDGSPMDIEVFTNSRGLIAGTFAVASVTGPYAYQTGSFEGTVNGDTVTLHCQYGDDNEFQMTGKTTTAGFLLTRSDVPGSALNFAPQPPSASYGTGGNTSMTITTGGTDGKCTVSKGAYSTQGPLTAYRGKWQGANVTFWQYNDGVSSFVIHAGSLTLDRINFPSYLLTDFPTISVRTSTAKVHCYSVEANGLLSFQHSVTCSP